MKNCRIYGEKPFKIVVIHGGPGAIGDMDIVAEELSKDYGILEPLLTAKSIRGQIDQLNGVLRKYSDFPVILIGHSWGAWLAYLYTAKNQDMVRKLILVGSGPFKEEYAKKIMNKRLNRLSDKEKEKVHNFIDILKKDEKPEEKILSKFGRLMTRADSYKLLEDSELDSKIDCEVYRNVWKQAKELRRSGELLDVARLIDCRVVAIHGEFDPHPYEGVKDTLSKIIKDFDFILIKRCGHKPWVEKEAKDTFFNLLREQLLDI